MRVIRRHFLACGRGPSCQPLHVQYHIDQAASRAPGRWMTVRLRKGTTWSRGRRGSGCTREEEYEGSLVRMRCCRRRITGGVGEWSGGMAWPAVGVVWRQ